MRRGGADPESPVGNGIDHRQDACPHRHGQRRPRDGVIGLIDQMLMGGAMVEFVPFKAAR